MQLDGNNLCVTALYDIGREAYDGRKWKDYLSWFEKILLLKTPFVVYGDSTLRNWVMERREGKPTLFIEQALHDIPCYHYKEAVSSIINSDYFRKNVNQVHRLECNLPEYTLVIYSKLYWMMDAVSRIGNQNTKVFWVDAGCSRFIDSRLYNTRFPDPVKTNLLGDKFFIQVSRNYPDLISSSSLPENYFWLAKPLTAAGFMGGSIATVSEVAREVKDIFENEMLARGVVATEENAIGAVMKRRPDMFLGVINSTGHPLQSIHMMGELA